MTEEPNAPPPAADEGAQPASGADSPKYPDYIARCERGPVTRAWLADDLRKLGLRPGMLLMVHTSLSALGFVAGREAAVIDALRLAVGAEGTLVMSSFNHHQTNPQYWTDPPVPESWHQTIRDEMPAYDPKAQPVTRNMGAVPEYFRGLPGVLRSAHPSTSWCAQGPLAAEVVRGHALDWSLGDESPCGRCYELDGWVLSLGTLRTTILHLAERRAQWPGREDLLEGAKILRDGVEEWVQFPDADGFDEDFEDLRKDYMAAHPGGAAPFDWREGPAGYGTARLFRIRPLVDFAVPWIESHRNWE